MSLQAWVSVGVVLLVMVLLARGRIPPDIAMVGGLTLSLLLGVVPLGAAIAGFAHPAVLLIAALFVVAAGLQETGVVERLSRRVLSRPRSALGLQLRLMLPVSLLSGFMNNTAVVAIYLPIVSQWARKLRLSPSTLFMPLSFAANLGGKLSTIGTSSNVVVMTLFAAYLGAPANHGWLSEVGAGELPGALQLWGVAALGLPTVLIGALFVALAAPRLARAVVGQPRQFRARLDADYRDHGPWNQTPADLLEVDRVDRLEVDLVAFVVVDPGTQPERVVGHERG